MNFSAAYKGRQVSVLSNEIKLKSEVFERESISLPKTQENFEYAMEWLYRR